MILGAILHGILAFLFAVVAVLLMIVILLQRGKGVGLAGAFGGTGGHAAFGAKTGDVLTWFTVIGAGVLLLFAILLNFVFEPQMAGIDSTPPPGNTLPPTTPSVPESTPPVGPGGGLWHPERPGDAPIYADLGIFGEKLA